VSTFELAKKLQHQKAPQFAPSLPGRQHEPRLSVGATAVAGAASGIPAAFVLGPLERIKCRFQLHPGRYRSLLECAREAHRTSSHHGHHGFGFQGRSSLWIRVREVFRGTGLTVLRDVPGNAVYFALYESTRRQLLAQLSSSTSSALPCSVRSGSPAGDAADAAPGRLQTAAAAALAGGTAGVANWCLCLPVDAVKTRWQTAPPGLYASPRDAARAIVAEGGGRASALFRGLRPALLRAFPANAAALCGVEVTRQVLGLA
jgi:solute carrier family 25 carnitine/acylcarnitine transporter 20/29